MSAVSVVSHANGIPVFGFFVRKEAKKHGAQERIDGFFDDSGEVLLVDDVATSGGSILKALEGLREQNKYPIVKRALVIVDREEGAAEKLSGSGIELVSIFKKREFNIGK